MLDLDGQSLVILSVIPNLLPHFLGTTLHATFLRQENFPGGPSL
jgi:hypothetical protein